MIIDWKNYAGNYFYSRMFVLVNQNGEVIGEPSVCKDFLTDKLCGAYSKKRVGSAWSAVYDPTTMPSTDIEKFRVVYIGGDPEPTLDLIHQVEDHFGIPHSKYEPVENKPINTRQVMTYWEGDKTYMIAPPLHGFLALLIRNSNTHEIGKNWYESLSKSGHDQSYLKAVIPAMEFVFSEGPLNVFGSDLSKNWLVFADHNTQHPNVGPVAYAAGHTNKYFPHWKKFTESARDVEDDMEDDDD